MPRPSPPPSPSTGRKASADDLRVSVRLLREAGKAGLTRENLAKALGKSTRHASRVFELLEEQGADFHTFRENRNGTSVVVRVMATGPDWEESLSPEGLTALWVAVQAMDKVGTDIWKRHLQAVEDLAGHKLTPRDRILFTSLRERIRMRGTVSRPQDLHPAVLAEVLKALGAPHGQIKLELSYRAPGRPAWSRVVYPYALTHDAFGGGAFLLVWDTERKRAIHLRLNRIDAAMALGIPAVPPNPALMEHALRYQIGGWFAASEAFPVLVRVKGPNWAKALEEAPPHLPEVSLQRDGEDLLLRFMATEPFAPARWILQFGGDAVVEAPDLVRNTVRQRLSEALGRYSD